MPDARAGRARTRTPSRWRPPTRCPAAVREALDPVLDLDDRAGAEEADAGDDLRDERATPDRPCHRTPARRRAVNRQAPIATTANVRTPAGLSCVSRSSPRMPPGEWRPARAGGARRAGRRGAWRHGARDGATDAHASTRGPLAARRQQRRQLGAVARRRTGNSIRAGCTFAAPRVASMRRTDRPVGRSSIHRRAHRQDRHRTMPTPDPTEQSRSRGVRILDAALEASPRRGYHEAVVDEIVCGYRTPRRGPSTSTSRASRRSSAS